MTCRRFLDTRELKGKKKVREFVYGGMDAIKQRVAKQCLEMKADGFCDFCHEYGLDFGCPFPNHRECGRKARDF